MVTRGKTGQTPKILPTIEPSETQKAYIAGVVDADGHVALSRVNKRPPSQRLASVKYQAEIVVTNTDPRLIDFLTAAFGGRVYTRKKIAEHHKTTYSWRAGDRVAWQMAKAIAPYALIKQAQLLLLIEFYEGKIEHKRGTGATLTPEEQARRADIHARIRALVDDRRPQRLSERAPDLIG